ncbi:fungal hydrophobin-domain-containing protein [Dichomitus squalens]|uniref:Hydrophobin n=1 Tax=Dichomitus squalens TaxID=114155 RepID=A0A4Q9MPT7_9APHY|nr:fungal hydrophobin-domain-containing protein [Dichomitus squalens]
MFSRVAAFTLVALPLLAAATPLEGRGGEPASSCSTAPVQCCNTWSNTQASDPAAAGILGLLGIVLQDLTVAVGLTCSPITVIGAGSGSCSAQAVCCQDNSHGGLISIGCVPVTL